jgi:hypothetical protein
MTKRGVRSDFSEGYRQSGMTADNSMNVLAVRKLVDNRAAESKQKKHVI